MANSLSKLAPHSTEAERTTLGAILLDPERMTDIAAVLQPKDFYDPTLRVVYAAICKLYEDRTPIDFVTVAESLKDEAQVKAIGGSAFLAELSETLPTASHATYYAEIVKEKSVRRDLANVGSKIMELAASDNRSSAELVDAAEQHLLKLSHRATNADATQLSEICHERYDHYSEAFETDDPTAFAGIATGFSALDGLLGGLRPGQLIILAARPSIGKTALALNIARNVVSEQGKVVGIFSLEMSKEEITDRLVASDLAVDTHYHTKQHLCQVPQMPPR